MKYVVFLFVLIFFCLMPARQTYAEEPFPSLFFTENEAKQIEDKLQKKDVQDVELEDKTVHLGAVLYYGPNHWTIWLQGERWTPKTSRPDLHIVEAAKDHIKVSVKSQNGEKPRLITLRPHQTYHLRTGQITEGSP